MMENKNSAAVLAVIGAGIAAKPILEKARELNITTYCFSTAEGACAKDYADNFFPINIFDVDGIYNELLKIKPDGIIASSEITTEVTAVLADKLGLPGNGVKNGFSARNKYVMRKRVEKISSICQPEFYLYRENIKPKFPVVVKAPDSYGKKGISLAHNDEEFAAAIEYAKEITQNGEILIEEYLAGGTEYSVECLCNNDDVYVVQITEKETSGPPHFVELGHHQPAQISDDVRNAVNTAAKDILNVLEISCGMAHLEVKIIDGKIYFIEVGARAGGDSIGDRLVQLSTDCDYYKAAIETSFGTYEHKEIKNVACSGIYFLCRQTEQLLPLFKNAKNYDWCREIEMFHDDLYDIYGNGDDLISGRLIYMSDHKVTLDDLEGCVVRINDFENAYDMLFDFNREIGIYKNDEDIEKSVKKFLKLGNVFGIIKDKKLISILNLYCNNTETLESYVCNVYVLKEHRRKGLAKKLMEKAIDFTVDNGFKKVALHVAKDNFSAIKLYEGLGFEYTGNTKIIEDEETVEMVKSL